MFIAGTLLVVPVEATPVQAIVAAAHQAIGGRSAYPGVLAAGQLARGLSLLGFDTELIPACTVVCYSDHGKTRFRDVGVWKEAPVVRADGSTDGHVVVWCDSLNRCIDLAPCQDRMLRGASTPEEAFDHPVVLPVVGGRRQLLDRQRQIMAPRPPFALHWTFFPDWAPLFDPLLDRHSAAIEQGGLAMAHAAVDLLAAVAVVRDLSQLDEWYPRLGDLLSGRQSLPTRAEDGSPEKCDPSASD
ncbi:hypothetical protein [Plantactinospora sp. KLBMP9567]|uniref:hypothetical protein n=1 Tax=Plantactinospora sp. KLBMP9567 TaxID=3085900 RepID=UPI00298250A3|nr:hypothetical protein [Plantactinospora sp. KLBMP9567]MDW5325360.1 hypothetical protein [Plantactinospora sp. KLBMP9567]